MATLILVDSHTLSHNNIVPHFGNRPGFVMVAAINGVEDARTQIRRHKPEVVVIVGVNISSEFCSAVARAAATEASTRVIYLSPYDTLVEMATPPGISAILTRENSFEDLLATMLVVLHGGIFQRSAVCDAPAADTAFHGLSVREHEVLKGIVAGRTTKEMARLMSLSPKTVETYRNRLMQKLGLRCVADLVHFAVKNNLA